jgi:hypothetical protein
MPHKQTDLSIIQKIKFCFPGRDAARNLLKINATRYTRLGVLLI